jgi:ribosomal protein L2
MNACVYIIYFCYRVNPKVIILFSVDHPHGGGRGKSKGNKHPRSPWGWLTKGEIILPHGYNTNFLSFVR